ncbi:hypothetical protein [Limnoraphis robusta]|uniref:Uncharacterized protein n=1 Tax=Limnoraphis robusta CCNP1315 TaxID=3110306 RepID=A0ABU5U1S1_9CYAN|nr:hypothetical protein [Limnoraphis robusta]MEA5520093.1 hypothetical protein [Limnoraphis robusta CCNP1315]MEA5546789.1 hypothetical protein [Limnoraphis robusta CCNP1324]
MHEAFIDLDELIVRCRDKVSRKFIQEAVACYRAGAFRSCIVATWNAVVFDFLHKLRELELFGDKEAAKQLEEFDKLINSEDFKALWKFESDIPEMALTKFELISTVEKSDIERLFKDRSRCAHPSMTSLEEPFEATAELARYHLRSAVTHLLERPPVQGSAAKSRIFQDIKSEYFPTDPELARKYFEKSPLARAKLVLVKNIVIGLTTDLLIEDRPEDERSRQFSALNAISIMYHKETREILNDKLSDIIINKVTDDNWDKVIIYLGSISAWEHLSELCRLKAEAYIDKLQLFKTSQTSYGRIISPDISILIKAFYIVFLRESVVKKLKISLNLDDLLSLKENYKDDIFKEKILIPMLREFSSQATLNQLLSMRAEVLLKSDEMIQAYIQEKVTTSSLTELISILSNYQEDNWLVNLIEPDLEDKIATESLQDLLRGKSEYISVNEPKDKILELFDKFIAERVEEEIEEFSLIQTVLLIKQMGQDKFFINLIFPHIEKKIYKTSLADLLRVKSIDKQIAEPKIIKLLDDSITKQLKVASFDDLLSLKATGYWDKFPEKLRKQVLKKNIPAIIVKFAQSPTYKSAGINASFVVEVAEYLTQIQWENILDAFFQNNQLCYSFNCCGEFQSLFKKSFELNNNSVQPYWLTFREKLNQYNDQNDSLKLLIDSYLES